MIKVPAPPEATSTAKSTNGSSCDENIPTGEVNECEINVNEVDVLEDAPSEPLPVELEYQGCSGVHYSDLALKDLDAYEFLKDYPMTIHPLSVQSSYNNSNLLPTVNWNTDSLGNFKSLKCDSLIARDKNNSKEVAATTTNAGKAACTTCVSLQFNMSRFSW